MIKRKLFNFLKDHLKKKEICFIIGPRQCGKTFLMNILKNYLEKKGEKTVYFNLDIEMDKVYFLSQQALIKKLELEFGKNTGFVFIDEIQRKEDAGVFLKGLYDMNLPYKFIVSGSGSVELKEKIKESLAGRKRLFELTTITFEEFINFRTEYKYEDRIIDFLEFEKEKSKFFLDEYLIFGGYPRVILEKELREKIQILNEIYQSYIEKDISFLLKVKKTDVFSNLIKLLASQIGQLINYSKISGILGISYQTLKEYLWYLEKTFIIQKTTPFYTNFKKELIKSPIYYFNDLGLRNFAINQFNLTDGFLFQNLIYNLLKEKIRYTAVKINFWRTKDKAEVDFVLNSGKEIVPIEVKYFDLKKIEIPKSLKNFIKKYSPKKAYIVNISFEDKTQYLATKVNFIPFYRFIDNEFNLFE